MLDRAEKITIAGVEYNLVLTTRATKEISARYGGLEMLGERLANSDNMIDALSEVVWLVTLLANQGVMIDNLQSGANKQLLTADVVELLTSPADFADYKDAITAAMIKGTKRHVESDGTSKNAQVG